MNKVKIENCVCTITQGKKLDELLGRVAQYGDNLFHHVVFCPDPLGEQWYYEVVYKDQNPDESFGMGLGEIVCNAYCDAELDQLLPEWIHKDEEYRLKQWRNIDTDYISDTPEEEKREGYNICYQVGNKWQVRLPEFGTKMNKPTSAQAKAQCLIWLIETGVYIPQIT